MNIIKKIYKKFIKIYTEFILGIAEKIEIKKFLKLYKNKKKILLFLTPEYANLGDHAITLAIIELLKEKYKDNLILEFTFGRYKRNKKVINELINQNDIIILSGGGNFGNLYMEAENMRRSIIEKFKYNKIISMPQSITYTNDEKGRKELEKSKKIFEKHLDLNIIARDKKSYEYGKQYFTSNNIFLAPDSVLYWEDKIKINKIREGIILTLRSDKEKVLSNDKRQIILNYLAEKQISYTFNDTLLIYHMNRETREYEVKNMLRKISSAKLNITDRFHGVIFSVITNTPVIVFKSLDHKIEEGVKWFKHLDWVHYVTTVEEAEKLIDKYMNSEYKVEKENYELKEKLKEVFFNI